MDYIAEQVSKIAPDCDARHIKGFMLLQYGTLGHLDRETIRREVKLCAECARVDRAAAERNARSYGL